MANGYPQTFPQNVCIPPNNPRQINPSAIHFIRPPNEAMPNDSFLIPQHGSQLGYPAGYNGLPPPSTVYPQQFFPPYSITQATSYINPNFQEPTQINQSTVSTFRPAMPQNSQQSNPHEESVRHEKRQKHPLSIINPESHKEVVLSTTQTTYTSSHETPSVESIIVDSVIPNPKPTINNTKAQIQADFRRKVFDRLADSSDAQIDQNTNQQSTSSSQSGSITRAKSPISIPLNDISTVSSKISEQLQPNHLGILTRNFTDDKLIAEVNQDDTNDERDGTDTQKQPEFKPIEEANDNNNNNNSETKDHDDQILVANEEVNSNQLKPQSAPLESVPIETRAIIDNDESRVAPKQRLHYGRLELLRIRDNLGPFPFPPDLPDLEAVLSRCDNNNNNSRHLYKGTNSDRHMNPQCHRKMLSSNHPSLTRYTNKQNSLSDSKRKTGVYLKTEPDFDNRVENPYKPANTSKIDANDRVLRDIKSILNKITPQTYDKLQEKLEALDIDRYERLEGMIKIFFAKAVDEPGFCFLYAKLCKQFQNKQVTVSAEDGKTATHYFRQILLTRCQNEFENDYRDEVEYEKRKVEIEASIDEKKNKEEQEQLEEDLIKAKRRKLGNIFFIGELFKLRMLTDSIMYDCIEYLLRDKTDEESLECLCCLLRTIGKELDAKANEKPMNKSNLQKQYRKLDSIIKEQKTSSRIRFMIQDLIELRQAAWIPRRDQPKPVTIDEIHEQGSNLCSAQNRGTLIGNAYGGSMSVQNNVGRESGMKQKSNRNEENQEKKCFTVNSLRELQSNHKQNQGSFAMSLGPPQTWSKGSGVGKKPEKDNLFVGRTSKPPASPFQQFRGKISSLQTGSDYSIQRSSSRELALENTSQSLRKTAAGGEINTASTSTSMTNSQEGSRNVSCEATRNASHESSISSHLSLQMNKASANESIPVINQDSSITSLDEEKIIARVHSLIEEYTENYSDLTDRPIKEAQEDLSSFRTSSYDQQTIIIRELFTNVLEAKPRARKAVGHLLDAGVNQTILSTESFLSGFKMIVEAAPDYIVDIPLIWQYIGEILGAFFSAPTSNMALLKSILACVSDDKSKQLFQFIIRYATEYSSQSHIRNLWQASGFSLSDLVKSDLIDESFSNEYKWLFDTPDNIASSISQTKENHSPRVDPQLFILFKSFNDQSTTVTDSEIITYISEHMDPNKKFYIRNIVLSYLEACLISIDSPKKIQGDIAKHRMTILNTIIDHKPEAEVQAVYAIQSFVHKLEHPPNSSISA
ncbi:unnamed protein product [Rotaria sp. Silwood2]|nr:unnamed protein product [Rotaria sp. Silwood2]